MHTGWSVNPLALSRRFNNFPREAAIAIPLEYPRARTFSLSLSLCLSLPLFLFPREFHFIASVFIAAFRFDIYKRFRDSL